MVCWFVGRVCGESNEVGETLTALSKWASFNRSSETVSLCPPMSTVKCLSLRLTTIYIGAFIGRFQGIAYCIVTDENVSTGCQCFVNVASPVCVVR